MQGDRIFIMQKPASEHGRAEHDRIFNSPKKPWEVESEKAEEKNQTDR